MARRRVKIKSHEKLDDANIRRVIGLLNGETPITKRAACKELNIAYNTARLDNIIQEYKDAVALRRKLVRKNWNKPWSNQDKKFLISGYLTGLSIADLSRYLYRSREAIKRTLAELQIPMRDPDVTYSKPALLPDGTSKEYLEEGELVWSARYDCLAEVRGTVNGAYKLWVFGTHDQWAVQPWYELGVIPAIAELGMTHKDFKVED